MSLRHLVDTALVIPLIPPLLERRFAREEVNLGTFVGGIVMGRCVSMDASRFLHLLFTVLVTIGLAIAPLASPLAAGNRVSDTAMHMTGTSGDMPCCPDEQKAGDCQDCPLLAICILKVLQSGPSVNGLPMREAQLRVLLPCDEPEIAGLTRPPPDHPPRTIV